jgi:DNA processing protein
MVSKELRYWVGFSIVPGIGRVKFSQLETHFKDLEQAWKASPGELRLSGLDSHNIKAIEACRSQIDLDAEMGKLEKNNV